MATDLLVAQPSVTLSPSPGGRSPVFRARGLTKIYRMGEVEVPALQAVDLDLYAGEMVVFLGPSGSGKSTLLNILGGLDAPTSGSVWFLDHNLTEADADELTRYQREHVGFVFQFYNLIPSLTARENVQLVTEISDHPMAPEEALRLVGLGERPDVLLCDEPTGALDYETGKLVLEVLDKVVAQARPAGPGLPPRGDPRGHRRPAADRGGRPPRRAGVA